jgi:hypothetical protein
MTNFIKIALLLFAAANFLYGMNSKKEEEKHFYLLASDIFVAALLLSIVITQTLKH